MSAKERVAPSPARAGGCAVSADFTPFRVRVPASSANLGSGFDTLGLALGLYDTVDVEPGTGEPGAVVVEVAGSGAGAVPLDERHLVVRVLLAALHQFGLRPPALTLRCVNSIPHGRGLGSSAGAIVAGVLAALRLAGHDGDDPESADWAMRFAASYEGHADNVAACIYGGLAIAWNEPGSYRAVRLEPHRDLTPVVFVPRTESSTHTTRGLLPATVPHGDAAFAASRSALAVYALTTDPALALAATDDRIHQDYREQAWPDTVDLVRRLRNNGVAAAVSGAGPTVLAFPADETLPDELVTSGFDTLWLPVERTGARCTKR